MKRFSQYLTVDLAGGGFWALLTGPSMPGLKGRDYRVAGLMFSGHLPGQGLWTSLRGFGGQSVALEWGLEILLGEQSRFCSPSWA